MKKKVKLLDNLLSMVKKWVMEKQISMTKFYSLRDNYLKSTIL